MFKILLIFSYLTNKINCVYFNDYDEVTYIKNYFTQEDRDFVPINTLSKDSEKIVATRNINCDDFKNYALNCTIQAARIYNSSRKAPPMPANISDWCRAIKYLTSCAEDWNADCREVTERKFYEESINGHLHVVSNVCMNERFISQYERVTQCIESTESNWENCYSAFKNVVDEKKNTTREWTHYETHFYLCCARARFRLCTLELLFETPTKCSHDEAVTLQRFSVIVSEGDVYQDCDINVMYSSCPGGDPRPNDILISKFVMQDELENMANKLFMKWSHLLVFVFIHF
ncbi:unnamed protein product [Parnassius mnemosyne]|uniref:Uncharacterized protein n=1 Tax=Parnassius mnemosyne TaxID=213953 RepID=A0AAV1L3K8_9NEOP